MLVLPLDARLPGALLPKSPFTLYTFPDTEDPPMVVVDTITTDLVHTEPDEVVRLHDGMTTSGRRASPPRTASPC